jgi:hypothetical protein|tara:strand:+ start:2665 stop:2904 length:240 start_codon:yes stop_codon:yes gene_type:complete
MMNLYELAKERKKEVVTKYGGRNLSRMLNISHPAVSKWQVIPPLRAYQIADIGDFELDYLRPDLKHADEIAPQPQGVGQ